MRFENEMPPCLYLSLTWMPLVLSRNIYDEDKEKSNSLELYKSSFHLCVQMFYDIYQYSNAFYHTLFFYVRSKSTRKRNKISKLQVNTRLTPAHTWYNISKVTFSFVLTEQTKRFPAWKETKLLWFGFACLLLAFCNKRKILIPKKHWLASFHLLIETNFGDI